MGSTTFRCSGLGRAPLWVVFVVVLLFLISHADGARRIAKPFGRLPGEFERQDALMVGCSSLVQDFPDLFVDIVRNTQDRVGLIALVNDLEDYHLAKGLLNANGVPADHVRFLEAPHDTMWTRDYGPMVMERSKRQPLVLDADYDPLRVLDEHVPAEFAIPLNLRHVPVPLALEGGNLLTNGRGLGIMGGLHRAGFSSDRERKHYLESVKRYYGLKQIVVLESLMGETTGHVDMFATFTAPDTVIVGQYHGHQNTKNAAILDRNAEKLSRVITGGGELRVIRIPMPPSADGIWRTYTNVVYANGAVLVPVYPNVDLPGRQVALETFASALPGWEVIEIDASRIIQSGGALHCVVMNLGPMGSLTELPEILGPLWQEGDGEEVEPGGFPDGDWEPSDAGSFVTAEMRADAPMNWKAGEWWHSRLRTFRGKFGDYLGFIR